MLKSIINKSHILIGSSPFSLKKLHNFFSNTPKISDILKNIKITTQDGHQSNVVSAGIIQKQHLDPLTNKVSISLKLTKDFRRIKSIIKEHLQKEGFNQIDITLAPKSQTQKYSRKSNLTAIKSIIAVSSCKGGVGKSTIAVNLAASLANEGNLVGIFDSDIYGPSLPTLINREGQSLQPREENPKEIKPIEYEGMKCMSFGFVGSKPAVMRGPMVSSIVSQLLHQTHWGQLDYLVIDMPPGTGDIQLSLCQELKIDGAIIVTTPQRLAFMDVIKGIQMFNSVSVRILGVIQNMSYYQCSKCGNKDYLFGPGYTGMIKEQFGITNALSFPLMGDISKFSDAGTPLSLVLPKEHQIYKLYLQLVKNTINEIKKPLPKIFVHYNTSERKVLIQADGKTKAIDPHIMRLKCRCAGCIDQLTGAMLLNKEKIDPDVYPTKIEPKGNYAVGVVWSDGHRSSIYPYIRLLSDEM